MKNIDYNIKTSQIGIHKNALSLAKKHLTHPYQKPISPQQYTAFDLAKTWIKDFDGPIILDSGCGKGMSTHYLAEKYPSHFILGIDKSAHRLPQENLSDKNYGFIQANLEDFWHLAAKQVWKIDYHYLLYPNPWPKPNHLMRRWHGHPILPDLLKLGNVFVIRSNWLIYLEEFAEVVSTLMGFKCQLHECSGDRAMTHFEKKYWDVGEKTYELIATL